MEVPEGVKWDRKRSPKPNLHVCGEDDIKKAVYNVKESIEKGGIGTSENKEYSEESLKNKRTKLVSKEKIKCYSSINPSTSVWFNRFSFKVNLVFEHLRSTNFIVWAFNVRTQYQFRVITN